MTRAEHLALVAEGAGPLLDPDCRDDKHQSCVGDPCECACHTGEWLPRSDIADRATPAVPLADVLAVVKGLAEDQASVALWSAHDELVRKFGGAS